MFIGGLNWETTDRKHHSRRKVLYRGISTTYLRADIDVIQNLFTTISLNSAKLQNAQSCEMELQGGPVDLAF